MSVEIPIGYPEEFFSQIRSSCGGEGVFLCYRTRDTAGYAGRLYDRLSSIFGTRKVFYDKEGFGGGARITPHTQEVLDKCSAFLALIGPNWMREGSATHDYVVAEIEEALRKDLLVLPVLVDDTKMPSSAEIPERIQGISDIVAYHLRSSDFTSDLEKLILRLKLSNVNRGKCSVILSRKSQFIGSAAIYDLEADGQSVGHLGSGESANFFVESGARTLRISHHIPASRLATPHGVRYFESQTDYSNELNLSLSPDTQVTLYCYSNWRMKMKLELVKTTEYRDALDVA